MTIGWDFRWIPAAVGVALLLAAGGCDTLRAPLQSIPSFQVPPRTQPAVSEGTIIGPARQQEFVRGGAPPPAEAVPRRASAVAQTPIPMKPTVEALSLEQVTLPNFINEVFSKALNLTVQIDQRVMTRTDIVTLRTGSPLPSQELFRMAEDVLAGYGVGASWDGSVLHIVPTDALMAQMPTLIRSRALPEMPVALRPIFQVVDLHQVSATDMAAWLTDAYGARVKVFPAGKIGAVMIFGLPENVRDAVEAARVLDQARLAGRRSLRVGLVYWTAKALAAKLVEVLRAEGYDAGIANESQPNQTSTLMLIPVETSNSLIAFAADAKILAHVRQWVSDLDQASQADPLRSIFVYMVQNTTAASLGQVVQAALGQGGGARGPTTEVPLEQSGQTRASTVQGGAGAGLTGAAGLTAGGPTPITAGGAAGGGLGAGGAIASTSPTSSGETQANAQALELGGANGTSAGSRLVIDQARNALVFVGTAQDYQRIRPLLEALDRAPREALIEVTVAELTLSDTNNLGFEFTQLNHFSGKVQSLGTGPASAPGATGLPLGTSGFNYALLNGVGDVRVLLNAFADNNHVSVLSTPRILAKSGSEAKIDVGTQVPIITSQGTTNTIQNAGTSGILQSISYQQTGVLLSVKPIIHSGNRIELTLNQEVSEALPNSTPGITSPLIQNRSVSTDLTLRDGQTVMIGGMIAENRSSDDSGVPYLKDIPGVGTFFRNQALSKARTELLVFITPYVIASDSDAGAITAQFQNQMQAWPIPNTELHW